MKQHMNNKTLILANIHNLTSFWKTAGQLTHSYHDHHPIYQTHEWPFRTWFSPDYSVTANDIEQLKQWADKAPAPLVHPAWDIQSDADFSLYTHSGFEIKSTQTGMYLPLNSAINYEPQYKITLARPDDAATWGHIFSEAFNYVIPTPIIEQLIQLPDFHFYLVYHENTPIGTGVLHVTDNIAGIHAVGTLPTMRKKGIGKEMMLYILKEAKEMQLEYVTLQASDLGKSVYLKLGFMEHFVQRNYGM